MEHASRPRPLVIARVFASLAPTIYSNMYFFEEPGNIDPLCSLGHPKHPQTLGPKLWDRVLEFLPYFGGVLNSGGA